MHLFGLLILGYLSSTTALIRINSLSTKMALVLWLVLNQHLNPPILNLAKQLPFNFDGGLCELHSVW